MKDGYRQLDSQLLWEQKPASIQELSKCLDDFIEAKCIDIALPGVGFQAHLLQLARFLVGKNRVTGVARLPLQGGISEVASQVHDGLLCSFR